MDRFLIRKNCSKILRYLRRVHHLHQEQMAKIINCSKSQYSRLELAEADLEFYHCALLNEKFGIKQNHLIYGIIDEAPFFFPNAFSIPKKLAQNNFSKGPELNLYINYFKQSLGEEAFEKFCMEEKIDPLVFVDLRYNLNIDFILRIVREFILRLNFSNKKNIYNFVIFAIGLKTHHGKLLDLYESKNSLDRSVCLLENINHYQENIHFVIEDYIPLKKLVYSFRPKKHVNLDLYSRDPIIKNCMCKITGNYIKEFSKIHTACTEIECFHKRGNQCIYQMQVV